MADTEAIVRVCESQALSCGAGDDAVGVVHFAVAAGDGKLTSTTLAGKYDFGVLALSAAYSTNKTEVNGADDDKIRNWLLGVSAPIGAKVVLKASYVNLKDKLNNEADARQLAIGADYLLSKRTKLYTAYSKINNDDNARYTVGHASGGQGNNEAQFNVGINHSF